MQLPIPPSQRTNLEDSFTIVSERDCVTDDISDIGARIEEQLQKQLTMCKNTRYIVIIKSQLEK